MGRDGVGEKFCRALGQHTALLQSLDGLQQLAALAFIGSAPGHLERCLEDTFGPQESRSRISRQRGEDLLTFAGFNEETLQLVERVATRRRRTIGGNSFGMRRCAF